MHGGGLKFLMRSSEMYAFFFLCCFFGNQGLLKLSCVFIFQFKNHNGFKNIMYCWIYERGSYGRQMYETYSNAIRCCAETKGTYIGIYWYVSTSSTTCEIRKLHCGPLRFISRHQVNLHVFVLKISAIMLIVYYISNYDVIRYEFSNWWEIWYWPKW